MLPAFWHYRYLFDSHLFDLCWEIFCLSVSTFGLAIRCFTVGYVPKGTSGRNTKGGQIAESLNTTGIYSILRNPLYLGNFFMMLGVVLFLHHLWLCLVFSILFWVYYERIVCAEESFLLEKFGAEYIDYTRQTRAFLPSWRHWRKPAYSFSWKSVLRREYSGLLAMVVCFFALETVTDAFVQRRLTFDPFWLTLLALASATYLTLRTLKKRTHLLDVEGR